jgi:LytS/YehU family sensor histidine kinase
VLYPLAVLALFPEPVTIPSIARSLLIISLAVVLAAGGWWISGRLHWPDRPGAGFWLTHLAIGLLYAATWWLMSGAVRSTFRGAGPITGAREAAGSIYLPWNLLFGLLIYGLCTGLAYVVRAQDAVRAERLNAANATAAATRARLAALQSQLNPHFLFNVLHTTSALVRTDPESAEQALDRLGDLMRYALDRAERETVLLRDEWAFVEDYLAIERLRLGTRLHVECKVDPEVLDLPVPPFSVQPLVENAIRHGIAPRPGAGRVTITALPLDGGVRIDVADDGTGADPAEIEPAAGSGLRTLRQRLASGPWPGATVAVETSPGNGFHVRVDLPAPRRAAADRFEGNADA